MKKMTALLDEINDTVLNELAVEFETKEYNALRSVIRFDMELTNLNFRCEVWWLKKTKEMSCSVDRTTGSFCLWRQDVVSIQFLSLNRPFYDLFAFKVIVTEEGRDVFEDECYIRFDAFGEHSCHIDIMAPLPNEENDTSHHICSFLFESLCSNLDMLGLDDDHCSQAAAAHPARRRSKKLAPTE